MAEFCTKTYSHASACPLHATTGLNQSGEGWEWYAVARSPHPGATLTWVGGEGGAGPKRDPWARELEFGDFHDTDCVVRATNAYPWHDERFRPPAFNDLIVYQFHVGVFSARDDAGRDRRAGRVAKFLDALDRVEYLADLGVNAVQPLPFVEFRTPFSHGYNGTDIFSPEMDYCLAPAELAPYLARVNRLLAMKGCAPLTEAQLTGQVNQLKAFVDVCHLYGLAVLADVVYNHAGGSLRRGESPRN